MAKTRQERINEEVRRAVHDLGYINACRSKGQDVRRLAEKDEKAQERLERHARCFVCGTKQEAPESVRLWEMDRLGSECRVRYAGMTWQEAIVIHRARSTRKRVAA